MNKLESNLLGFNHTDLEESGIWRLYKDKPLLSEFLASKQISVELKIYLCIYSLIVYMLRTQLLGK